MLARSLKQKIIREKRWGSSSTSPHSFLLAFLPYALWLSCERRRKQRRKKKKKKVRVSFGFGFSFNFFPQLLFFPVFKTWVLYISLYNSIRKWVCPKFGYCIALHEFAWVLIDLHYVVSSYWEGFPVEISQIRCDFDADFCEVLN